MESTTLNHSKLSTDPKSGKVGALILLTSFAYTLIFALSYHYFWNDLMHVTSSLLGPQQSSGEIILKTFFACEALLALISFAYLTFHLGLRLQAKVYLEMLSLLLALRVGLALVFGLEFFVSLLTCLIVHTVVYIAAIGQFTVNAKWLAKDKI